MSGASKLLEMLEAEMQQFTEEVRETTKAAVQVRELVAALRQASDRWKGLEGRVQGALEELERLEKNVKAESEQLEVFRKNAISDLKRALEDLRRELREAIGTEKERLAEIQNVVFKELQDHRDYLKTKLEQQGKKMDEIHNQVLKAVTKAEVAQKRAEAASTLSKWALTLALTAIGAMAWFWLQGAGGVRVP